ncbi:MAG: hypothetical protein ACTSUE_12420 [Promethearchaeota archaeon]
MNGKEHMYWSLASYSVIMFIYSTVMDFKDLKWIWYVVMIFLVVCSILLNDYANYIYSSIKRINKDLEGEIRVELSKKERKKMNTTKMVSYGLLFLTMTYAGIVAMPASGSSLFILLGYMTAYFGGVFPDFDSSISVTYHRHPSIHSGIFPLVIGMLAIFICPVASFSLMIPYAGFLIGVTSHLIADNLKSNATLADVFVGLANEKGAPGDIRQIREDRERAWLFLHYAFLIVTILLMFMRKDGVAFMNFPDVWTSGVVNITLVPGILLGFTGIYYLVTIIAFQCWK